MPNYRGNRHQLGRLSIAGLAAITLVALLCAKAALAADRIWINPAGGIFNAPANWQGGAPPSVSDTANFNLNSAAQYTITFGAPTTVRQLILDQDNLLLDLSGYTLTATLQGVAPPSVAIAETAGGTGNLEIRNGTLATQDVKLGDFGTGTLSLSGGAKINSSTGTGYVGFRTGATGTLSLSGTGTSWTAAGHVIGNQGDGYVTVSNGASLVTTEVAGIGSWASSHGFVTITGPGSSWTGPQGHIDVGSSGQGTLTVNDRGLVSMRTMSLGYGAVSSGIVNLDGATAAGRSTIAVSGDNGNGVGVANTGTGTLTITNGALFTDGGDFLMGYNPGGKGSVAISGAAGGNNAELKITGALQMARSIPDNASAGGGNGSLSIGTGGSVTVGGTTYLGSTGVGAGIGSITLNGGAFTSHGLTASAGSNVILNAGTFTLNGGSFAPSSNTLAIVGATAADNVTLRLTSSTTMNLTGSLSIGGSASAAGPGTGLLSIESGSTAAFGGRTQLWTGGTLNIAGGTFKTSTLQQAGGTFNFTAGGLYLTGSDFTLGSGGLLGPNLTLASGIGNRNALSVSGTTTLDAGSSLNINNGGAFSTGKLANNGGAFSFGVGSLSITSDDLTIGAGSPVGSAVSLTFGRSLSVSGAVTIDPGASLTINGGAFSAASLINNGSFDFLSGTLGGSSDLIIDPGQLLGANFTLGAGRHISSAQGLLVGKSGTATMTLSDGGTATSARGFIGQLAGSNGAVSVSGAGSKWTNSTTLAIGGTNLIAGGAASLTISNGALVSAASTVRIFPAAIVTVDAAALSGSSITNQGQLELANASTVSGTLTNSGTLKKTGGGVAILTGVLNNNAAVKVLGGTLALGGGAGTSGGSFSVADGATLSFAGTYTSLPNSTLSAASSISGAGSAVFTDGWHVFNTAMNLPDVTVRDATPEFNVDSDVAHLSMSATTFSNGNGLFVNKTLSVHTLDFSAGNIRGTGVVNVSGPINFTGIGSKGIFNVTVNSSGNTLWTDNGTVGMSNATFNNLAGATFEAQHISPAGPPIAFGGSANSTFNNYGSFVKSTGDLVGVEITCAFNNFGTVDLQKGALRFTGGGSNTGTITGAAGTTLGIGDQTPNPTTFQPSSTITTAGNIQFQGTPVNFFGHLNVGGTTNIINASFLGGADLQSLGSALIVGGTATFSTGLPQALPPTTLNYELARINGTDDLTTAAPFSWVGGYISGSGHFRLNGGGALTSTSQKTLANGTLDNVGSLIWSGGTFNQHSTFNNLATGTLDIRGSNPMEIDLTAPGPSPVFNNAGALIKSAGNTTVVYPLFNNTGSVEVRAGTLVFGRNTSSTGSYSVSKDAGLVFAFGSQNFAASSFITGDGDVRFAESPVSFHGSYGVTGSTTVGSSTSGGTTTPVTFEPGSTVTDLGRLVTINTYGNLTLNTGNTVTLHDLVIWGSLAGTDKVVIAGQVSGGGSIQTEVVNDGSVSPGASPGTLKVKGNYTQDASASLKIEIATLTSVGIKYPQQFDILNVTGQADLAGTLELSMLDGYQPTLGERFDVLTYASHTGTFDQVVGSDLPNGLRFDVVYGSSSVELVVATPEPSSLCLLCVASLLAKRPGRRAAIVPRSRLKALSLEPHQVAITPIATHP